MLKPYINPSIGDIPTDEEIERRNKRENVLKRIGMLTGVYSAQKIAWSETTPLRKAKEAEVFEYMNRGEEPPQELIDWLQDYWRKHPDEYVLTYEEVFGEEK